MKVATLEFEMLANIARLAKDMEQAKRTVENGAENIQKLIGRANKILGLLGVGVSVGGLVMYTRSVLNTLDALNDVKDATGAAIEGISALEDVAVRNGGNLETASSILIKYNKVLSEAKPGSQAELTLKAIGLSAKELQQIDPAEALLRTSQALGKFADDGTKARVVQDLFGKSIKEAGPFLKDLAEAGQLNAKVTAQLAEEAERFNKHLFQMKAETTQLSREIASSLLPTLNAMLTNFREIREIGGLGTVLKDAAKDMVGLGDMTGDNGADINRLLKERTQLERQLAFAVKSGLDARRIRDDIEQKNDVLAVLRVRQRTSALKDIGDVSDSLSRKLAPRQNSIGAIADQGAINEYKSLIDRIKERIAVQTEEVNKGRELTEQEKFAQKVISDVTNAKHAMSAAQKEVVNGLLAESERLATTNQQREKRLKMLQAEAAYIMENDQEAADAAVEESKQREQGRLAVDAYAKSIDDSNKRLDLEASLIGMSAKERAVALEQYEIELELKRQIDAINKNLAFDEGQREELRIKAREKAQEAAAGAQRKADIEENRERTERLAESISDGILNGFRNGRSFADVFLNELKAQFAKTVLQPQIKMLVEGGNQLLNQVMGGGGISGIGSFFGMGNPNMGPQMSSGFDTAFASAFSQYAVPLATGMDYVPFDNFPAMLHKGERVVTASDNRAGGGAVYAPQTTIQIDSRSDRGAVLADVQRVVQQNNKAVFEELEQRGG